MDKEKIYDAVVIGSGASGGWAAKELCEQGMDTLLLEAGSALDPEVDFPPEPKNEASKVQFLSRAKAVLSGQAIQARCMSFSSFTKRLFVNDCDNPYKVARSSPFNWYRSRQVGGRLHLWGRNALRISSADLKPASSDGFGEDWPINYEDLEPWYTKVETFLGVHGSAAGISNIPDGVYDRPLDLTNAEQKVLKTLGEKWKGRPATTCRIVKHNTKRIPLPLLAAQESGHLELRSDAVVCEIIVDSLDGKARGVAYIDRVNKTRHEVRCKSVILCASTIESVRIMLNSKSQRHPNGLGNSSGNLGHYITDHVMVFKAGALDDLEESFKVDDYDFGAQSGIYIPNFCNLNSNENLGFLRGYSLLGSVGRIEPGWFFMAVGEMLPRYENCVELDAKKKDAWGIPVVKIKVQHSENEHYMIRHMQQTLTQLAEDCGLSTDHLKKENVFGKLAYQLAARLVYTKDGGLVPGSAIHESGGAGMGSDPKKHVLNCQNQVYDAPNVFVTDASSFTSSPFHNPGLTIMALSARAGKYIAENIEKL